MINQDAAGSPADIVTLEDLVNGQGLTFLLAADPTNAASNQWDGCAGIPRSYVLDRDGVIVDFFCGYNETAIRAAVEDAIMN